jgi:hypothetical protein
MGFQTSVSITPAIGVDGSLASTNVVVSHAAPEGGFVAGTGGATVGRFGWIQSDGVSVLTSGTGKPNGFIVRNMQALNTTYLSEAGNVIPKGFPLTLTSNASILVKSNVAAATLGQKAFASLTDGSVQPGAAGATISGYIETDFYIKRTVAAIGDLTVINKL